MYRSVFIILTVLLVFEDAPKAQTPVHGATFLPIIVDDNLVVTDTFDTPSAVHVGDVILEVNNVALKSLGQYQRLIRKSSSNTTLRLRLKRLKTIHNIEVKALERPLGRLALPLRNQTGQVVLPTQWTGTTIVYVWSVACQVCTRVAPEMAKLAKEHPGIRFVALSPDSLRAQRRSSTATVLGNWPLFHDGLRQLNSLMVSEYPTFWVLNGTEIRSTFRGRSELPKLKRVLQSVTSRDANEDK